MNSREIVRRLEAWHAGRALPRGTTRQLHLAEDDDVLVLAFVRMGGESRPWGVAWGRPGRPPSVELVPEGRNRDLVAAMMAAFAPALLAHLESPGWVDDPPDEPEAVGRLRQVWLPNTTHLDMLHHLAFAYTRTRHGGERRETLKALGRACGWLFREAQRPGQQTVMVATRALCDAYTFPAEEARQGHLGYLLAWLATRGDRKARLEAALEAERQAMATSLDPAYERERLADQVEAWGRAQREGDETGMRGAEQGLDEGLEPELVRRFELVEQALARLRADRRRANRGLEKLVDASRRERWWQYLRREHRIHHPELGPAFVPSVETDRHAAAAAAGYLRNESAAGLASHALLVDDAELQAEAIASGDAVRGEIVEVWDDGDGRRTLPVWRVHQPFGTPLRLKVGDRLCVAELPGRELTLRAIESTEAGYSFELEITRLKLARKDGRGRHAWAPVSQDWVGESLTLIGAFADFSAMKGRRIWERNVPGGWLTHGRPGGDRARPRASDHDDVPEVERGLEEQE